MKVFKTFAVSLILMLGSMLTLGAQNREVSGQVLDVQSQPIIGAAVMWSGTGVMTDVDGNFTISVPAGDVELEINCLAMYHRKFKYHQCSPR